MAEHEEIGGRGAAEIKKESLVINALLARFKFNFKTSENNPLLVSEEGVLVNSERESTFHHPQDGRESARPLPRIVSLKRPDGVVFQLTGMCCCGKSRFNLGPK